MARVTRRPLAEADIFDIWDYIAEDSVTAADRWIDQLESALAPAFASPDPNATVMDAASRFVAQGGAWTPSADLARAIDDAAMGRVPCRRL